MRRFPIVVLLAVLVPSVAFAAGEDPSIPLLFYVDIRLFSSPEALWIALALTVAAIIGKQPCSLGVLGKGVNSWAVGFGMIPRGEFGLIFASIGASLILAGNRIIDDTTYSSVVIMVLFTTLITPPLLKWTLIHQASGKKKGRSPPLNGEWM